jgi:hypothetical protein
MKLDSLDLVHVTAWVLFVTRRVQSEDGSSTGVL